MGRHQDAMVASPSIDQDSSRCSTQQNAGRGSERRLTMRRGRLKRRGRRTLRRLKQKRGEEQIRGNVQRRMQRTRPCEEDLPRTRCAKEERGMISFEKLKDEMPPAGGMEESGGVAALMDVGALDVLEVFSSKRMTKELKRFGLRDGVAVDIEELKPNGQERGGLDREEDFVMLQEMIWKEEPLLLTSSPPCKTFSPLRNLSNSKRDPEVVSHEEDVGRSRLRKSMHCRKMQDDEGRWYLREHPDGAWSWEEPEVKEMEQRSNTYVVRSPMCKFKMISIGPDGREGYVRKMTRWMTNSKEIADELRGTCENDLAGYEVHRHVHLIGGGRAKAAEVYPVELVRAVLRGLKKEMRKSKMVNGFEEDHTGPSPDVYVEWEQKLQDDEEEFTDNVSGAKLEPELVKKARQEELDWLRKEKVYQRVPRRLCEQKGAKLLKLKWVDVNKGDTQRPKVRSRLVTKEVKRAKGPEEKLSNDDVFASMPPVESVATLFLLFMSGRKKGRRMGFWDISRAHFMGPAARELFGTTGGGRSA